MSKENQRISNGGETLGSMEEPKIWTREEVDEIAQNSRQPQHADVLWFYHKFDDEHYDPQQIADIVSNCVLGFSTEDTQTPVNHPTVSEMDAAARSTNSENPTVVKIYTWEQIEEIARNNEPAIKPHVLRFYYKNGWDPQKLAIITSNLVLGPLEEEAQTSTEQATDEHTATVAAPVSAEIADGYTTVLAAPVTAGPKQETKDKTDGTDQSANTSKNDNSAQGSGKLFTRRRVVATLGVGALATGGYLLFGTSPAGSEPGSQVPVVPPTPSVNGPTPTVDISKLPTGVQTQVARQTAVARTPQVVPSATPAAPSSVDKAPTTVPATPKPVDTATATVTATKVPEISIVRNPDAVGALNKKLTEKGVDLATHQSIATTALTDYIEAKKQNQPLPKPWSYSKALMNMVFEGASGATDFGISKLPNDFAQTTAAMDKNQSVFFRLDTSAAEGGLGITVADYGNLHNGLDIVIAEKDGKGCQHFSYMGWNGSAHTVGNEKEGIVDIASFVKENRKIAIYALMAKGKPKPKPTLTPTPTPKQ